MERLMNTKKPTIYPQIIGKIKNSISMDFGSEKKNAKSNTRVNTIAIIKVETNPNIYRILRLNLACLLQQSQTRTREPK